MGEHFCYVISTEHMVSSSFFILCIEICHDPFWTTETQLQAKFDSPKCSQTNSNSCQSEENSDF